LDILLDGVQAFRAPEVTSAYLQSQRDIDELDLDIYKEEFPKEEIFFVSGR